MGKIAGRILNRSFYYGGSSILGKAIGFVMLPVYTNYLTPKDYGAVGFLLLFIALFQVLMGANLEQAISKFYFDDNNRKPLKKLILTSTVITFGAGLIPFLFSLLFSGFISGILFGTSDYSVAVKIASFNIILGILEIYGMQYIRILDDYKSYLKINIIKLLIQLSSNIYFVVYLELGVQGVMVSSVLGSLFVVLITYEKIIKIKKGGGVDRKLVKPLILYSAPLWVSGLVGLYTGSIHQVFITYFSSLDDLGLYNLANTFGSLTSVLLLAPFFKYWQVERFRIYNEELNKVAIFRKFFYVIMAAGLLFSFLVSIGAKPIILIMSNVQFHDSASAVAPLALSVVVMYLVWYLNFSFLVTSNTKEIAVNNLYFAVIQTALYFVVIKEYGFVGAAYSLLASTFILLHLVKSKAKEYFDIGINLYPLYILIPLMLGIQHIYESWVDEVDDPIWVLFVLVLTFVTLFFLLVAIWSLLRKKFNFYRS